MICEGCNHRCIISMKKMKECVAYNIGCMGCETDNLRREDVSYVEEDDRYWYCNDCIKESNLTKKDANTKDEVGK